MTEKRFTIKHYESQDWAYDNGEPIYTKDMVELLNHLHEENIRLKKVIEEDEKLIQSTYDELTKLRHIKKNLGRIKSQWDYIMEAIQYD